MYVDNSHKTVLLHEAVDGLNVKPDGIYVDGTFGRGGHSRLILEKLGNQGKLIAIDRDPQAKESAKLLDDDKRFSFYHQNFASLKGILASQQLVGKIDGVLLDLGVSSPQLDQAERGFSFMKQGELDMRMDTTSGVSAKEWLATAELNEIRQVLKEFGEEKFATRIATAIVERREEKPIETTTELAELIEEATPVKDKHKHPATRSFQAIRIFVNQELEELKALLDMSTDVLAKDGRLSVISFHSLEDRIVKRFMKSKAKGDSYPKDLPIMESDIKKEFKVIGKAVKASHEEIKENPRSRSAVLRVAEKITE